MPSFVEQYPRNKIAYASCISLFTGLICSKFLISLSMIALLVVALLSPELKEGAKRLKENKSYWAVVGIFLLFGISALMSFNVEEALNRLRIATPLLLLPFAFAFLPPFSKRQYQELLSVFIYGMLLACLGVLINYLMNYQEMQQLLVVSKAIPTPNGEHIRFSLMINIAVFASFWLLQEQFCWKKTWEKWIFVGGILFLMMMIHLLSVRIGLVILYAGLGTVVFYYIFRQKRYGIGLLLVLGMLLTPYLAYKYVPSVQTKVNLTRYNWTMYQKGYVGEYSDTRRLLSYEVAWKVAQQAPWVGVGIGDLNDEQTKIYKKDHPHQDVMYPHNFLLTLYAGTGILGLIFFLFCFFFPLFYQQNYKNLFFLLFQVTIFLSFMTENTLLSAIGVAIYSFFLLLATNASAPKQA